MAFVPGITVRQELRDGTLVRIPLRELAVPRRTLMIYREQGYVSDTARELIKIVRAFNWDQGFSDKVGAAPSHRGAGADALRHADPPQRVSDWGRWPERKTGLDHGSARGSRVQEVQGERHEKRRHRLES